MLLSLQGTNPSAILALADGTVFIGNSIGAPGAAALHQRRCQGCRLEINAVDIDKFRAAAADEVLRCEECRRILVRTSDSGL